MVRFLFVVNIVKMERLLYYGHKLIVGLSIKRDSFYHLLYMRRCIKDDIIDSFEDLGFFDTFARPIRHAHARRFRGGSTEGRETGEG